MREYIHFFENSDLRDAYEYGSDYTEPYVSYTPVINEYKAQFDGTDAIEFIIKKQRGEYLISLSNEEVMIISLTTGETTPKTNNNLFYAIFVVENGQRGIFVIEEDLELTDLSTEVTVHEGEGEGTLYIVNSDENVWEAYEDSEHTSHIGTLVKFDIVSTPSSGGTDSVHYNKKYNVIYINTYKSTNACGAVTGKGYNIRYLTLVGGIPYEEIFGYLLDNDTLVIIRFYDQDSNEKYYAIYKRPIDTFTNTYPSYTANTESYRTVISQEDYVNFDPEWEFSLILPSSCIFDDIEEEEFPVIGPGIGDITKLS